MDKYEEFVEKFKPKKTTDDCYTPKETYKAVADWVANKYGLNSANFVRPFFPGGDYENYKYKDSDIVVDNPPFSKLAKILDFYKENKIKYFLFAPGNTAIGVAKKRATVILTGNSILYSNGARVLTGFVTNLEPEQIIAKSSPTLYQAIKKAQPNRARKNIKYNDNIMIFSNFNTLSRYGIPFEVTKEEGQTIRKQEGSKKEIFGCAVELSKEKEKEKNFKLNLAYKYKED